MKIKLCQWFDEHWYRVELEDDRVEYFPSVTTKLQAAPKPFLARWRGDIGNREADLRVLQAADKGTRIHHGDHAYSTGGAAIYNPWQSRNYTDEQIAEIKERLSGPVIILQDQDELLQVWRFQQWMQIVKPKILNIEYTVYSQTHREAGTLDYAFEIEQGTYKINGAKPLTLGGIYIADIKSGGLYDEARYQLAAYRAMYEEMNQISVAGTLVLHTNAKTRAGIPGMATALRTSEDHKQDYDMFRRIAAVWEAQNVNAAPRQLELPTIITQKEL